jgi:protein-S-isoprenylcysteine O-methyltransferase Ste14
MLALLLMTIVPRIAAWLGGAAFAASLALTLVWYFGRLGHVGPYQGGAAVAVDAALIAVFAAHHSLFAREGVKRSVGSVVPAALLRASYVWASSVLLTLIVACWREVGGILYSVSGIQAFVHAAIQASGVGLIARAVAGLDPLELAGIRQVQGTMRRDPPLQIGGPYRWVRHPVYLGWMLLLFGTARLTGDRLVFAALTSLYLAVAVRWEERSLLDAYGDDYARYRARVVWRIIPYVY